MIFASGETVTITVLNLISGHDTADGQDFWKKKTIDGCSWVSDISKQQVDAEMQFSQSVTVRIPKQPDYQPYEQFVKDPQGFTLSVGDYIVKGQFNGDLTNVIEEVNKYPSMQIKAVKINEMGLFDHYKVQGI